MKSIGIDFSNRMLCIMTEGQQGKGQAKKTGHRYIYFNFIGKIDLACSYSNKGKRSDVLVPEVALFEEKKAI